jgi:hypothetical protein
MRTKSLYFAICLVACLLSLPVSDAVLRVDDWDFIHELHTLSVWEYLFRPNPAGQLNPVFKAVYGLLMAGSNYNNLSLGLFNFTVGVATIAIWLLILYRLACLTVWSALILCCIRLSYAGMADVFLFPLQGALELAFFFFTLAVYLLVCRSSLIATVGAALALMAGAFSWGNGLIAVAVIPVMFALLYPIKLDRKIKLLIIFSAVAIVALAFGLVRRSSESEGLPTAVEFAKYLFASSVINGMVGGLMPERFPGIVHVLFFLLLAVLIARCVLLSGDWKLRFVVVSSVFTLLGIQIAVSLTRAHHGLAHAGSYRYVYMTVFFQAILLALSIGQAKGSGKAILAVILLLIAIVGGIHGRRDWANWEHERQNCLEKILGGTDINCIDSIYYRRDPEFVQKCARMITP